MRDHPLHQLPTCWVRQRWPCHESSPRSPPRLPFSTPPTGLDECFFFTSLVVRLPYILIFCQFWLFFVFKLLSFFWLCEEVQCVYLCLHLGFSWLFVLMCFLVWYSTTCLFLLLFLCIFGIIFRKLFPTPVSRSFPSIFSSSCFRVLGICVEKLTLNYWLYLTPPSIPPPFFLVKPIQRLSSVGSIFLLSKLCILKEYESILI